MPGESLAHRLTAIAASVALHTLCAAPLLWAGHKRAAVPAPAAVQLIALPSDTAGILLDAQSGTQHCSQGKAYVGIDVKSDLEQRITVAPESYPGFKAGLRLGDVLANPYMEPDAAGYDSVDFTRHGKYHHLQIKTQWICLR